mgnify:CR=1 FL=1
MGNSGNLWHTSSAERVQAHALDQVLTADLVIIGGGFTGCAAALSARELGARVVLLEAQTIGYGGSGRNVGLVNAGLWLPPDTVLAKMGASAGARLNTALGQGPDQVFRLIDQHGIACEARRNGTLHCAHAPKGMRELTQRYEQLKRSGAPVALLSAADAQQATGTQNVFGALQDNRAGTIQPLGYVRGLARAAEQAGAHLFEHSPAVQITQSDGQWTVTTPNGAVTAPKLLQASNAYPSHGAKTHATKTAKIHYFQMATQPLSPKILAKILPDSQGCWDTGLIMKSFRRDAAGRLIFGAMGRPDRLGIHRSWARRSLRKLFPELGSPQIDHFWSGAISVTQDHIPKMRRIGDQAYDIFGYSGRGISPGTVLGTAAAQALLQDNETLLPLDPITEYHHRAAGPLSAYYELGAKTYHFVSAR